MSIRAIYESYVEFCISVGYLSPPSFEDWLELSEHHYKWGN